MTKVINIKVPGYFQNREYSYCVLGNGVDLLYLDWSGAMSFKDQINGNFAYWYKLDRKTFQKSDPLPLLRAKYHLISPAGPVEIAGSKQSFDPETGVLTTLISAEPFEFKLRSLLTNNHLFVLEFNFRKFPEGGSVLFALDDNRITYTRKLIDQLSEPVRYSIENSMIKADYRNSGHAPFQGIGLMDVLAPACAVVKPFDTLFDKNAPVFPYLAGNVFIQIKNLKKGDALCCVSCLVDSMDSSDFEKVAFDTVRKFKKQGFQKIYTSHRELWKKYSKVSQIHISNDTDYIYRLSKYLLKAVQFKTGAIIPSAVFPNNHGCLVYWDALFDQIGLLRTNHIEEAKKITEFWLYGLEKARENAGKFGAKGAYYGWNLDFYGHDPEALKVNQIHLNGDIALSCWNYYEYTGDMKFLKNVFPVMKETIDFLIYGWIENYEKGIRVKSCASLDESSFERVSDTWTTALIIKGIENIVRAADILGKNIDTGFYRDVRNGLMKTLENNVKDGILFSHSGFGNLNVGTILALIILEKLNGVDKMRTFKKFVNDVKEQSGLGWGHSSRMRCMIFPWAELIASIFLARNKNPLAQKYIENATGATNSFGGIAEYIWLHNLISRNWFVTAHGTFLWAITEMLVCSNGENIVLFPGVRQENIRENLSFKNILIEGNILASCNVKKDKLHLSLYNGNDFVVKRTVCFQNEKKHVEIKPKKRIFLSI